MGRQFNKSIDVNPLQQSCHNFKQRTQFYGVENFKPMILIIKMAYNYNYKKKTVGWPQGFIWSVRLNDLFFILFFWKPLRPLVGRAQQITNFKNLCSGSGFLVLFCGSDKKGRTSWFNLSCQCSAVPETKLNFLKAINLLERYFEN